MLRMLCVMPGTCVIYEVCLHVAQWSNTSVRLAVKLTGESLNPCKFIRSKITVLNAITRHFIRLFQFIFSVH